MPSDNCSTIGCMQRKKKNYIFIQNIEIPNWDDNDTRFILQNENELDYRNAASLKIH